jgi:AcrR family transcriptional regulator
MTTFAALFYSTMDEKFEKIINESAELFSRYGIRNLSMDDICREIGISKKTLYQYVENKADLVKATLANLMNDQSHKERWEAISQLNAIDQLLESSRLICDSMKRLPASATFELKKYYPAIFNEFFQLKKEKIFGAVAENIRKGIAEGFYRSDLDVETVARLYVQKLENIHNPEFLESVGLTPGAVFKVMYDTHIRGIANAEGIKYYESTQK